MRSIRAATVVLLICVASSQRAQTLDGLIPHLMQEGDVPGLAIVVIRDSRVQWHRTFGVANRDTGAPLTDETVFESTSLGKPVFAYAVLKLADAGKLSLDVPLSRYLPEPVTDDRMKRITARMVLDHTTGFQNEVIPGETLRVHFTPGERFSYSGAGYLYLQRVVVHVTGKPLAELMGELVFAPLAMTSSGYVWLPEHEQLQAYGHSPAGIVAPRRRTTVATVATLHTTPSDFARFLIAVMKGKGLRPPTARAMLSTQTPVDETCYSCLDGGSGRMSPALSWGLGWALERTPRGTAFWHWGENNAEFQNLVMGYPNGDGVVVFTNSGNGFAIMPEIVSAALGGEHPAFAWMGYETYRSPAKLLQRRILESGAEAALGDAAAGALSEGQLNRIGYFLLERKRVTDALAVFRSVVQRFPASFNAYDSLGEAYLAAGDRANAIANYQRSLELNANNANAAAMVQKILESNR